MDSFEIELDEGNEESRRRLRGAHLRSPGERQQAEEQAERELFDRYQRGARASRRWNERGDPVDEDPPFTAHCYAASCEPLDETEREELRAYREYEENYVNERWLCDGAEERHLEASAPSRVSHHEEYSIDSDEDYGRQTQDVVQQKANSPRSPKGSDALRTVEVEEEIRDALMQAPEIDASDIDVHVLGNGEVVLSGRVTTRSQRESIEQIAHASAGTMRVRNDIEVASGASGPGATRQDVEEHVRINHGPSPATSRDRTH